MEEPDPKKLRLSSDISQSTVNQSAETLEYELDIDGNEAFDGAGKENGVGNKGHMPSTEPDIFDKAGRSNCWKNDDYMKNCDSHGEEGRIEHINGFSTERASLMKIESVKKDAVTITNVIPNVDLVDVYKKILARRNVKHRVDLVTLELLEGASEQQDANANASEVIHSPSDEIFKDVAEILLKFPNVDPSYIYDLLERNESKENRVAIVLDKLGTSLSEKGTNDISRDYTPPSSVSESLTSNESKKSDPFSDPEFRKNPLYRDLRTLRKVLPAVDPNELYAYLEAHFDKPNRVQIVIDELAKSDSQDSLPVEDNPSLEDTDKGKAPMTTEDKVQADLKGLKEIFRDCDPSFLYEKLVMLYNDSDRVVKIASELFERKDYPKIEETKGVKSDKKHPKDVKFDIREFLVKFPDPFNYFENTERMVSDSYKEHALIYVKNTFPFLKDGFLKKVLNSHKYHLLPAITEIDTAVNDTICKFSTLI
ncbi:hypothetical protein DPMN_086589 [Dreissena polymorpha]|uniref:CUE domain-containing protein n=1 Tax=Dreissena polymorpha TaxID=45954 RepID=A0A9D4KSL1_DREPO|nr:hypothetical protein DPMN_086589 [Dreissena polymorpha]